MKKSAKLTRLERVERLLPGYKVIAGPFNFMTADLELRKKEIKECRMAKEQCLLVNVDARVLLLKDGAWVLRDGQGWKVMTGGAFSDGVRSLSKERELERNRDLKIGLRNTRRVRE